MQNSKSSSEYSGRKPKAHRQSKQSCPPNSADLQPPQKTISELFATSKHKPSECDLGDLVPSSPSKRLKRDHRQTLQPENMYNFPSSSPKPLKIVDLTSSTSEVIDLTTPSCGNYNKASPLARKPNGVVRPTTLKPGTSPKKLVVKNLRRASKADPDQYYNHVWGQLDSALAAIFGHEEMPYSLEELYRGVENLCRQGKAPELYQRLSEKCSLEVSTRVKAPLVEFAEMLKNEDVLRSVVKAWSTWRSRLETIRSIFFYMDRSFLLHSSQPSIEEMGIIQFRKYIFSDTVLNLKILQGVCDLVMIDREEQQQNKKNDLFRDAIGMLHVLTVYKQFESMILDESKSFLHHWAAHQVSSSSLATYVANCHKLIDSETNRCDLYNLDANTKRDLVVYLDEFLIEERESWLLRTEEISVLLDHNEIEVLKKLFTLLQRRGLEEKLRSPFQDYIRNQGSEIVFDQQRESEMVVRLLAFKKKLDNVWQCSFEKNESLGHGLREAFESFINKTKKTSMNWGTDNPKPGEMIAKYVDVILRGGVKAVSLNPSASTVLRDPNDDEPDVEDGNEDVEITKQLDQVLDMFRFVHGKAVFEAFYKKDLARRLLMARSASSDAEKSMLTRLKSECGAGFTHNLEQMFKDIELAREEIASYKTMLEERRKKPVVDLNVNVLSASAWPTYPDVAVEVPRDIQKATADFEEHYKMKHTGRRLAWKHALAHCQLKAQFPRGNKEIVVSSFQAIVMLLFNDKPLNEPITYAEIQATTNLSNAELKRTLQSLACAKYRVLNKTPKGKDVNEGDSFAVNLNFSDPKYRIKINQIQLKETKEENKETHERVAADRHYETQAAIVRIMKTRKTITHAELVSEVITATKSRGVLDPTDIKKNIEKLIEKDYMEREEGNTYRYLA